MIIFPPFCRNFFCFAIKTRTFFVLIIFFCCIKKNKRDFPKHNSWALGYSLYIKKKKQLKNTPLIITYTPPSSRVVCRRKNQYIPLQKIFKIAMRIGMCLNFYTCMQIQQGADTIKYKKEMI